METIPNIIYKAKNEQRKCFYIGRAIKNLTARKSVHKSACYKQNKKSKFYNFIRKYGWDSFTWEVLAVYSTPEELPSEEIRWLAEQKKEFPDWECLNSTEAGIGLANPSKETREKIRKSKLGKNNPNFEKKCLWVSETNIKRLTGVKRPEISGENYPFWQKKRPEISERMKGENHPMFGKHHTQESNEKNRISHLGKFSSENSPHARKVILISPEGREYNLPCYKPFCKEHNISNKGICAVLRGKRKHHKGWTGKYL